MATVKMHEAKSTLSALVAALESGAETEIVLTRNGDPVARLVPIKAKVTCRFDVAKGRIELPDDFDAADAEIAGIFGAAARAGGR